MNPRTHQVSGNALTKLLDEVDALCAVLVGKNAEGEAWGVTCDRLVRIDKLRKRARAWAAAKASRP